MHKYVYIYISSVNSIYIYIYQVSIVNTCGCNRMSGRMALDNDHRELESSSTPVSMKL